MSDTAKAVVLETMKADIRRSRDSWPTFHRDTKACDDWEKHNVSLEAQSAECQGRYLATARARIVRYRETGQIG